MAIDLEVQKEIAKVGMTVTMGVTVATAFKMKTPFMKTLHTGAGVALVGFSLWHHLLYQPEKRKKREKSKSAATPSSSLD